ncbi:MAG: amidohydrolase family protein, partial [Acidimicrobiales bacterium]
ACYRAYNDWAREFNAFAPERLVVLAMLPGHEPGEATAELRRVVALGHRGAMIGLFESDRPLFEDEWDGFWATAGDLGVPIHFHLGGGLHSLRPDPGSWRHPAMIAVVPMQLDEALSGMIFAGVFQRHSDVRLVLGESGLGWIPYVLERMDHEFAKYRDRVDRPLEAPPSEYFRKHVFATYEEDGLGLEMLARIGARNVMWASDYPHGDSTWPNSLEAIATSGLATLDEASRRRILWDNAAELYHLG